jgi:hypothetical protein
VEENINKPEVWNKNNGDFEAIKSLEAEKKKKQQEKEEHEQEVKIKSKRNENQVRLWILRTYFRLTRTKYTGRIESIKGRFDEENNKDISNLCKLYAQ